MVYDYDILKVFVSAEAAYSFALGIGYSFISFFIVSFAFGFGSSFFSFLIKRKFRLSA